MKRTLLALLAAALSVGVLSGCGSKASDEDTSKKVDLSQIPAEQQPKKSAAPQTAL